ncbi:MAG: glycyl radical protein [Proteocatella sp.]
MNHSNDYEIAKSPRIDRLVEALFEKMPEIESDRAVLITESYKQTEGYPIITRRAKAFAHILDNIPITIRRDELIVGSSSKAPRGCQVFPEFSFDWLEAEFETLETRSADPFHISKETQKTLSEVYKYWKGKTTSELATSYMEPETKLAIDHYIFTPGNYYYNGVGHVTVCYDRVISRGLKDIIAQAEKELQNCKITDENYMTKSKFLKSVIESNQAVIRYAGRYAEKALEEAENCDNQKRRAELLQIASNCSKVPENGASSFHEACQSFWFIQMLLQMESSGHSISPGRFDQYMYPYYKADIESGKMTKQHAQELMDCIWVKLNDLNKVRDAGSAEGFAGYGLFQNLIAGGQNSQGLDVTNELSYMCIEASMHVMLPQPSLSVRVWNGTPHEFMIKAVTLTRNGTGLPAYYNDEVIIPSLISRGLSMADARDYNIIGCVEPQKAGKTDGWHDAAFFNMCRPMEMVFSNGMDKGIQLGPQTGRVENMKTFEEFYNAYKIQMEYFIALLVNADNAIDVAHAQRCPLPFLSGMIQDCIGRGKSVQEGGAVYNFTGPQGFGIANMADSLYSIKKLVFDEAHITLAEYKKALDNNFGRSTDAQSVEHLTKEVVKAIMESGKQLSGQDISELAQMVSREISLKRPSEEDQKAYGELFDMIESIPKFGNDVDEVDAFARDVAFTYTQPLEKYRNPRGGSYQAGLYPVSANVPLGAQTGATPDGRLAHTPVADGVSPSAGKDINGPTAAANSVAKLDHYIASNGTLFNQKFHPLALSGRAGLENFAAYIRAYFDQKGSHIQFNVVSRDTLIDAQKNPEQYKTLVVRVAGYSALFTTLSRSLQEDIIKRTEQSGF